MKNGLFNRGAYGLPAGAPEVFAGLHQLIYAKHAAEAVKEEQIRAILPRRIVILPEDVVEIEVVNSQPVKAVIRWPWDDHQDLCLVLQTPSKGSAFVRTVWFNTVTDQHYTLNRSCFARP